MIAYVVVPWIVQLLESVGGYNPLGYEPKDIERQDYLRRLPPREDAFFGWETAVKLVLLVLVGLLWLSTLSALPRRGSRR